MLGCTRRVTPRMLSCLIPEGAPPVTTLQLGRLITAHSPCSAPPPAAHPTEGQEGNRGAGGESAEATSPPPGPSSILPCHDSYWEKPRQGERKHRGHHPPCTLLGTHSLRS